MILRQAASGKNETFAICLQLFVQQSKRMKMFVFVVNKGDIFLFLCDFKDYKKRINNQIGTGLKVNDQLVAYATRISAV